MKKGKKLRLFVCEAKYALTKTEKSIMPLCSCKNKNWFFIIGIFLFDLIYFSYLWMTTSILLILMLFFYYQCCPHQSFFVRKVSYIISSEYFHAQMYTWICEKGYQDSNKQKHQVREFIFVLRQNFRWKYRQYR